MNFNTPCKAVVTNAEKQWPYMEYYVGDRDQVERKSGQGSNHWSGAESLEWYKGSLLRDTMHGEGMYCVRYRDPIDKYMTFEGDYYNCSKHGYGTMSYADGRVFRGLYHNDLRWGPGVETHLSLRENVGLWQGFMLIRLTWKPPTFSVAPDLMSTSYGSQIVAKNRVILTPSIRIVGEVNPALELLKRCGAEPLTAVQKWPNLYPKHCTDQQSHLFQTDVFERDYYGTTITTLENTALRDDEKSASDGSINSVQQPVYTWNNNKMIIHMMKQCYLQDKHRLQSVLKLSQILNGPRESFKPAAQHELDCRTFLMACYLGHLKSIVQLMNEYDVNPNVSDIQGNSAIMYATCGNQSEVIPYLVEAGAQLDEYNDSCCNPLGVALLNFVCAQWDISPGKIIQAILPASSAPTIKLEKPHHITEWKIDRNLEYFKHLPRISSNKSLKNVPGTVKRPKSLTSVINSKSKKHEATKLSKIDMDIQMGPKTEAFGDQNESFTKDEKLYLNIMNEYVIKIENLFMGSPNRVPLPYLFEVNDMVNELDATIAEEQKKVPDKKEIKRDTKKLSRVLISASLEKNDLPTSLEDGKADMMLRRMTTIKQLLLNGADPRLVRCPQSALFTAVASNCEELVQLMLEYGVDVNEVYPETLGYSALDVAISKPFSQDTLGVIRTLLKNGAQANHRLPIQNKDSTIDEPLPQGPTLLHVVLARKHPNNNEGIEQIRQEILELLLEYGCDPIAQYKGHSAMEDAMSKHIEIFEIFVENPSTDLNAVINESKQSILLKMFCLPYCKTIAVSQRLQMLTNLLLFGADPLLVCYNGEQCYENLFVYTSSNMAEFNKAKSTIPTDTRKTKSEVKPKKIDKSDSKSFGKAILGDEDYRQTLCLVTNCARLLFIRWLQAGLMKELIQIVDKFKHRHWNMILKEYKNGKCCGLWLNTSRALEIWDVLKTTKIQKYNDKRLLKHVLCILHYHCKKEKKELQHGPLTSEEKALIETEVLYSIREHNSSGLDQYRKRPYVKPEITPTHEIGKFNICFECALPLTQDNVPCSRCKLVKFCNLECMKINVDRPNCHPCSNYLKKKYFPSPVTSVTDDIEKNT